MFEQAPEPSATPMFGSAPSTSTPFFESSSNTDPYRGSVSIEGNNDDAEDALSGYHFLTLTPGEDYTIRALREELDLDPAMWVFSGHSTYDDFQSSGELRSDDDFSTGMPSYLAYGDDQIDVPGGPYEDPEVTITAPESGLVTVVVTNYASDDDDGGDGRFDYRLEIDGEGVLAVEGSGGPQIGTPFFGQSPAAGTSFFGQAPEATEPFFFGKEGDWFTVTFDPDNLDGIDGSRFYLDGTDGTELVDDEFEVPAPGDVEPPHIAMWSNGDLSELLFGPREEGQNPWAEALAEVANEAGGPLTSGSVLQVAFTPTGDSQTVNFDWLLAGMDERADNSVAFYLTPDGDGGILGDTDSLTGDATPEWQEGSVDLQPASPFVGPEVMAMVVGVGQVGGLVPPVEGFDQEQQEPVIPEALMLLDNLTLVGVTDEDLAELPPIMI